MAIVVELLDAGNHLVMMQQFEGEELVIGRAYDCDFIVHDPHVDPYHCRMSKSQDPLGYKIQDENTVNGTRAGQHTLNGTAVSAGSGAQIVVGKTRLRVSDSTLPIPAAIKLSKFDQFTEWASKTWVCLSLLALAGLYAAINTHQHSNATFKISSVLNNLLTVFAIVLLTTGFWSLIGRISKRKANIRAHASIAAGTWILGAGWGLALTSALYNLNGMEIGVFVAPITSGLLTVGGQFLHLSLATSFGIGIRCAIVALMFGISPGLSLHKTIENEGEFSARANYPSRILPPAWYFGDDIGPDKFVQRSVNTFRSADREAEEMNRADQQSAN